MDSRVPSDSVRLISDFIAFDINDFSCSEQSFKFTQFFFKSDNFGQRSKSEKVTHKNGRPDIFYHMQKKLKLYFKI